MGFSQFAAFLITFREALEALLIVGIIMTYINRVGAKRFNIWVIVGVLLALLTSLGVAFVFQVVLDGFEGLKSQSYLRFGVMFVSVILLTHMVVWMADQKKDMKKSMEAKLQVIITAGSAFNMIVHSYLVVMREAVETVFFFAAISGGDVTKAMMSWGALTGLASATIVALIFFKGFKKIPLATYFKVTGALLIMIAAGLLSNGIGMMQDMGYMKSVHMTQGGQIGEVYNIAWLLPEHEKDANDYLRDHGEETVFSGNVGIFFAAMFGYSQNPSVEQFVGYWMYYLFALFLAGWSLRIKERREQASATRLPSHSSASTVQAQKTTT
ncbi:FTR1 family protein [Paenibacillus sp. YYML68]|uniref:FTR1 family iron permease n=1 Tax=Paenibacillus sp. YYML68 TaxID=2909250 RepID=UPI00248F48D8|nr:FTR1 family protein [Paenibacillus sp. YYML68]